MKLFAEYKFEGISKSPTLPPGKYQFELKGGGGGNRRETGERYNIATGGTTIATITFIKRTPLFIYVGGFANNFNGGGQGFIETKTTRPKYQLFGGGATDVRTVYSYYWNDEKSLLSRILVAGGGGSGNRISIAGTPGGGEETEGFSGRDWATTTGATQTSPGEGGQYENNRGSFGKGASGGTTNVNQQAYNGGGGGWYGGAGGQLIYNGTGGSGYILTKNSHKPVGYTPTSEYYFESGTTTCGTTLEVNNSWDTSEANGYCKIFLLDTIAPTISSPNISNLGNVKNNDELKYIFTLTTMTESEVKVEEKLNTSIINTRTLTDGKYETTIDKSKISPLELNSQNTITVTATDSTGKESIQMFTFTKVNTKPSLVISSYNSNSTTFTAIDTDNNLSRIEWFLDGILKETITTDLYAEKTINYELTDNAIHTLKIVAIDEENTIVEKVISISKNIMPPGEDANLNDITAKVGEIKNGLKNGKTSIVNVLAFKNIEADLDNSFTEISEKIKTAFDSGDASIDELKNKIVEKNNSITQLNNTIASLNDIINSSKLVTGYFCYKTGKITFSASLNKPITFAMALLYNDNTYAGGAIYSNGKSVDVGVYGGSLITVNGNTAQIRFNLVPTDTNKGKEYPIYFYVKA
ncbi:glycine-rich protein [Clostridioides difficile]